MLALAGLLFLFRIGSPSYWYDEAFSIQVVANGLSHMRAVAQGTEVYMLLYYALLRWWLELGTNETTVRLLSVLFMLGAVAGTWLLARRLFNSRVASVAGVLLTVNATVVAYAQEARSYALLLFLTVIATYTLVVALQGGQRRWWAGYAILAALIPYAHLVGLLVLAAHAIVVLGAPGRPSIRSLSLPAIAVGLALAPLAIAVAGSGASGIGWVTPLDAALVGQMAVDLIGGGGVNPPILAWILLLANALLATLGVASLLGRRRSGARLAVTVLATWLALPIVVLVGASLLKPMLVTRYLIEILPPLAILAAVGLTRFTRPVAFGAAVVVVALALAGDLAYYQDPGKPDWRPATRYVADHSTAHDRWLTYESWAWRPMALYAAMLHVESRFPLRLWRDLDSSANDYATELGRAAALAAAEGRDIWVIVPPTSRGAVDPETSPLFAQLREWYARVQRVSFDHLTVVQFAPKVSG